MTHRGLGGTAFEPAEEGRDREITLGPVMVAVLGLAFLAVCSVCFIGGYAVGRNSQPPTAAPSAPSGPSAAQLLREQPKPEATQNSYDAPPVAQAAPAAPTQAAGSGVVPSAAAAPAG
ncbi:MAG: hypothetical protein WAL73_09630, partial [Terracidiphilus sp.]